MNTEFITLQTPNLLVVSLLAVSSSNLSNYLNLIFPNLIKFNFFSRLHPFICASRFKAELLFGYCSEYNNFITFLAFV